MLLKNGRSQSTVGSGFMVGTSNLVLTNYHVVSQMALDPDVYAGEYVDTDGKRGPVELLAVDVLHDLAVVRINRNGTGFFNVPDKLAKLTQGQYLYSLGNPLDLGFAISEGSYNGVITRSFYDQLMFTGPINSGMSGGPSVTVSGDVAGVNVSKRRDGELVSFLVPVRYAQELLKKVAAQAAPPKDFNPLIGQQLLAHQKAMIDRLLEQPLSVKMMGPYLVPVRESEQVRCWGRSNVKAEASFTADTISCSMESAIYVSDSQQTGHVSMTPPVRALGQPGQGALLGPRQHPVQGRQPWQQQGHAPDRPLLHRTIRRHQQRAAARRHLRARLPQVRRPVQLHADDRHHRRPQGQPAKPDRRVRRVVRKRHAHHPRFP
jgi:serine protease Do